MAKKIFLQCATPIDKSAVSRKSIDGVEHIIISSFTLPDDIIMNGGLYPASEIEKSFHSLERTLAPVEHPIDTNGNFLSATDPIAIHNFHAGAFNTNVKRENGRVRIDKTINVQQALKSEKGKRLLDRINELETSKDPRPIHTSVGVFLEVEEHEKVQTNAKGQEFTWTAREMVFDHDAILLDSVAAAQPDQGVGMAVNADGVEFEAQRVVIKGNVNDEHQSFDEREEAVHDALHRQSIRFDWIEKVFPQSVIFRSGDEFFTVPYTVDDAGIATIVGIPLPVEKEVNFIPKTNSEGDAMMELILNALKAAEIETEGLSDEELLVAYDQLKANTSSDGDGDGEGNELAENVANAIAKALEPVTTEVASLKEQLNNTQDAEVDEMAKAVSESALYPNMDLETCKALPVDTLKKLAANCRDSFSPGYVPIVNQQDEELYDMSSSEMPD